MGRDTRTCACVCLRTPCSYGAGMMIKDLIDYKNSSDQRLGECVGQGIFFEIHK